MEIPVGRTVTLGLCCVQAELERQLSAQRDDNAVLTSENEALHHRIQQLTRDLVCITGLLTSLISVSPLVLLGYQSINQSIN